MGNGCMRLTSGRAAAAVLMAFAVLALHACGGGGGVGSNGSSSEPPGPPPIGAAGIYLKAGALSAQTYVDGAGSAARFHQPGAMTVDSLGNIWVEDADPNADLLASNGADTTLRTIDAGAVVKTVARSARPLPAQGYRIYYGLVADGYGNVYQRYGDTPNAWTGYSDTVGTRFSAQQPATPAPDLPAGRFCQPNTDPMLMGMDKRGALYCSESGFLVRYGANGIATTLAKGFSPALGVNGDANVATYAGLPVLSFDASGEGYFIDKWSQWGHAPIVRFDLRKISAGGTFSTLFTFHASSGGFVDGEPGVSTMAKPAELQWDGSGNFYFRDTQLETSLSPKYYIRKLTPTGAISSIAGPFDVPSTVNPDLPLNFAVTQAGEVLRFEGTQLIAYAPNGGKRAVAGIADVPNTMGIADGVAAQARFNHPLGVALDHDGNAYVADFANHLIRKIDSAGNVTIFAGLAGAFGADDGIGSVARFYHPRAIVFDGQNSLYVAHDVGSTPVPPAQVSYLRKIDLRSAAVSTVAAGAGVRINALAADSAGKIYMNDLGGLALRVFDPQTGKLSSLAPGAFAFPTPYSLNYDFRGLAVDSLGNVYTLDPVDAKLRKVSPAGVVSNLPGVAGQTAFASSSGLAMDKAGNLYVADTARHLVRKIAPDGSMTTVAGTSSVSHAVAGALPGTLGLPMGLALRQIGTRTELVITDQNAVLSIALP